MGCRAPPKKWYDFLIQILLLPTITTVAVKERRGNPPRRVGLNQFDATRWILLLEFFLTCRFQGHRTPLCPSTTTTTTTCEIASRLDFRGAGFPCATTTATTREIECLGSISGVGISLLPPPPVKSSVPARFRGLWSPFCCHVNAVHGHRKGCSDRCEDAVIVSGPAKTMCTLSSPLRRLGVQ